jgi:predicted permease
MARHGRASAVAAVVTLSLTLGVGTSILALVQAVLLTPPPFRDPERLVVIEEAPIGDVLPPPRRATYGTFERWRESAGSAATLEGFDGTNLTLTGLGSAERLTVNDVTPGFLRQLGVGAALGRSFESADVNRPHVVISNAFWRAKLGADPQAIGRTLSLGGVSYAIIGVLPESFVFELNPADVWRLIPDNRSPQFRAAYLVSVVARLGDKVPSGTLATALDRVSATSNPAARVAITPIATVVAGSAPRTLGMLGAGAVAAVLIAFVNLASLLVVRTIDRQQEIAIRKALGAGPAIIARAVLIETQALVALGIVGGTLLAFWLTPVLARLALEQSVGTAGRELSIDWRVLTAIAAVASLVGCAAALTPALVAARSDALVTLRRGASAPPRQLSARRIFVAMQVALALVLLSCVTILGATLLRMMTTFPGFNANGVLVLHVALPAANYSEERVISFYSTLHGSLAARLGSQSVAVANEVPLDGSVSRREVRTHADAPGREAIVREVSQNYFDVMQIPIVAGRPLDQRDGARAPARVVVSASLAAALPGLEQPIGRRIVLSRNTVAEIVGVAGDVKHQTLDEAVQPTVYLSTLQSPSRSVMLVVRTDRSDADTIRAVREEVARLDAGLPVSARSMSDVVASSRGMQARRVITATFIGFASLALVLSAIGLFASAAQDAVSRRTEFAIRMALGADRVKIVLRVVSRALAILSTGLAGGILLSIWAGSALVAAGFANGGLTSISVGLPIAIVVAAGFLSLIPAIRTALTTDLPKTLRN